MPVLWSEQSSNMVFKKFEASVVGERWKTAEEKKLCFRCLSNDHHGKDCRRTGCCGIDGCSSSHHLLLHDPERQRRTTTSGAASKVSDSPWEGAHVNVTTTTLSTKSSVESYSLRGVLVWVKGNGRKIKVNAVLDDAFNETFMNEDLAGALGLRGSYTRNIFFFCTRLH